ncbi:hypothetical protein [Gemelliphila palaticanis]|uniref:Uncharacterized protein n=1 Tax=Gemelliphila palaticanis TaxID=81950 RepID=A0ABX2T3I6_9BACL|nr:hypothetical protein [Gemella palaticanis]MBF0716114.1 hypothetical protein [Gemella palaticanis]NYS48044.1 hypothetical protein [Gemella palaticanis]
MTTVEQINNYIPNLSENQLQIILSLIKSWNIEENDDFYSKLINEADLSEQYTLEEVTRELGIKI